jgi:hypothetical protein
VFLRFPNPGGDPPAGTGYEVQIDDASSRDGAPISHRAIYSFAPPLADAANPVGEWNTYRIRAVGQQYTVHLNNSLVNQFTGTRAATGYLGLQNHHAGARVVFRNRGIQTL